MGADFMLCGGHVTSHQSCYVLAGSLLGPCPHHRDHPTHVGSRGDDWGVGVSEGGHQGDQDVSGGGGWSLTQGVGVPLIGGGGAATLNQHCGSAKKIFLIGLKEINSTTIPDPLRDYFKICNFHPFHALFLPPFIYQYYHLWIQVSWVNPTVF